MGELAVVTGASSGIGRAYAERLARDGWDLAVVARRRPRLEELATQLRDECAVEVRVMEADLGRVQDVHALGDELTRLPVTMLVNNAGLAHYMPFVDLPPADAEELVDVNVLAPVLLTRAVVPGMRERRRGSVINLASLLAFSGPAEGEHLPARAVYAATRSFVVTFTQILAAELRDSGVRVQVVCPGIVRTEFHTRQGMDLSEVPRMEPEMIVEASLLDLERGEVLCIPGLSDESARDRFLAAERELLRFTRATDLPARYRGEHS
jgi:short-subunit dehydrogenase